MERIILQIDLDSFYASVEILRRPELKGKPVVVCVFSGRTDDSGAVATANYLARELGIRAGMPISMAKERGKDKAVFLPTDLAYYREVSDRVMEIIRSYSDVFEQRSIDEAYLDLAGIANTFEEAEEIAKEIKKDILESEGLTCSIGIGPNKLVAKMASKAKKPDGLTIVKPEEVKGFLWPLPASKLFGVGPKSLEVFQKLGIKTIGDLAACDMKKLVEEFGENRGKEFHEHANGIDEGPVTETERQQLSKLGTLKKDTRNLDEVCEKLDELLVDLAKKISDKNLKFKTISVIAINTGLETFTKSKTLESASGSAQVVREESRFLMDSLLREREKDLLRRCGLRVSNFEKLQEPDKKQKTLLNF